MSKAKRVVVVGAGIGGLTTAAVLAREGLDVTVLEAHTYAGGCAGTFYHKGYRFDAGATLAAGFYENGPMDMVARAAGIGMWPAHPADLAMTVHLPNGAAVPRWGQEDKRSAAYHAAFGSTGDRFWQWQERTADLLWSLALKSPPWPPQSGRDLAHLATAGFDWLRENSRHLGLDLVQNAFRPVEVYLPKQANELRQFVDAQLLIAAQTTSRHANALYAASALDLPRRGVVHLKGGIGAIAETLVTAVRAHSGNVRFRQVVTKIAKKSDGTYDLTTSRGEKFAADLIIANLPPSNITELLTDPPRSLRKLSSVPHDGWSAFMVYCSIDEKYVPNHAGLHHQTIVREPMGEGNTVFISLSPGWDSERAPEGRRAVTISTHTALEPWWNAHAQGRTQYETRKQRYTEKLLTAAERALPGLTTATDLVLPGTPVTFQRFTRRDRGWVGGFPQTNLFRTTGPRLDTNFWMVGDSIFPGQSIAAVALGGLRVANAVLGHGAQHKTTDTSEALVMAEASGAD